MGTIIGSIYPLDNIVFEQESYKNSVNPAEAAASGASTGTGMVATTTNLAISTVLAKYGVAEPKPLLTMTPSELRRYKRALEQAVKKASPESDKNAIRLQITQVQSVLNEKSKERAKNTWEDIWGGLVSLSGAKPPEETTTPKIEIPIDDTENKGKNRGLYIGLGIGAGVLVLGTLAYLAFRKK